MQRRRPLAQPPGFLAVSEKFVGLTHRPKPFPFFSTAAFCLFFWITFFVSEFQHAFFDSRVALALAVLFGLHPLFWLFGYVAYILKAHHAQGDLTAHQRKLLGLSDSGNSWLPKAPSTPKEKSDKPRARDQSPQRRRMTGPAHLKGNTPNWQASNNVRNYAPSSPAQRNSLLPGTFKQR